MPQLRLFYATDLHGSEVCFRKFINAARFYKAEVLVMGGDVAGKMLIPIVEVGGGRFRYEWLGPPKVVPIDEVKEIERGIRLAGSYSFRTTEEDLAALHKDPIRAAQVFVQEMQAVFEGWLTLADERLAGLSVECYITPGNDDDRAIDVAFAHSQQVINPEGRVISIRGAFEMVSTGYSNVTPWHTPREEPEEILYRRIAEMADRVQRPDRALFCLHVPPYGSGLDTAPLLDEDLKPVVDASGMKVGAVGSVAVRDIVRHYQPMVGLHGHIHESRGSTKIGRTLCINPGSEYGEGVLRGALLALDDRRGIVDHIFVCG
jgi:uncharacterized protein